MILYDTDIFRYNLAYYVYIYTILCNMHIIGVCYIICI